MALSPERPQVLELRHPSPVNRVNGQIERPDDRALLEWLSDLPSVNSALASIGADPVGTVAWIEWVRRTG